jgi:heterodisulfide reductase subunit B
MKLLYYPGCTLKTTAENLEDSALKATKALGIELVELKDWYCCGAVFSLTEDDLRYQIAPIRNLINVQEEGEEKVVTLCDMCYNTLKQANLFIKEKPDKLDTLNQFLDEQAYYKGKVKVYHLLEILRDFGFKEIKKRVKLNLNSLKVAPYYGCMLLRPREVAIDDPENPGILEELMQSLGVEVIENPLKTECCGSYHTVGRKDIVEKKTRQIISAAKERGAEALVLSCPLCHFNLDARQVEAEKLPIFYFTELMSLAFGLELDFGEHWVNPLPLLKKKGILKQMQVLR